MSTEQLLLQECKLQLEYLNQKFKQTGTTNCLLTKLDAYFSAKERWEGIEKRERILPTATTQAGKEEGEIPEIVWEKQMLGHWTAEPGKSLLIADNDVWELWHPEVGTVASGTAPDLPTAKVECEKAYREHIKKAS